MGAEVTEKGEVTEILVGGKAELGLVPVPAAIPGRLVTLVRKLVVTLRSGVGVGLRLWLGMVEALRVRLDTAMLEIGRAHV